MSQSTVKELFTEASPNPLISVIVANYNNAKYLPTCIDSILSQTYPNIEIIIADDSSNDESRAIINDYIRKHDKIHALFHDHNVGVALNRHEGICAAKGPLITTLDADDFYYDRRKLEVEISIVRRYRESGDENIIAFSNFCHVNTDRVFIKDVITPKVLREGDILFSTLARSHPIPRDFVLTKEQYLNAGGYDQQLMLFEDWDLKIMLASQNRFYYTGVRGTAYRVHELGLVQSSPRSLHIKYMWLVFKRHAGKLKLLQRPTAYIRILLLISRSFMQQLLFHYPQARRLSKHLRYILLPPSKKS